jgi:hypothetical protein
MQSISPPGGGPRPRGHPVFYAEHRRPRGHPQGGYLKGCSKAGFRGNLKKKNSHGYPGPALTFLGHPQGGLAN